MSKWLCIHLSCCSDRNISTDRSKSIVSSSCILSCIISSRRGITNGIWFTGYQRSLQTFRYV